MRTASFVLLVCISFFLSRVALSTRSLSALLATIDQLQLDQDTSVVKDLPSHREALLSLFAATNGSKWLPLTVRYGGLTYTVPWEWSSRNTSYCGWPGVVCFGAARQLEELLVLGSVSGKITPSAVDRQVVGLTLAAAGLHGTLPTSIGQLTSLQVLQLTDNPGLAGTWPASLTFDKLEYLEVQNTSLTACKNAPAASGADTAFNSCSLPKQFEFHTDVLDHNMPGQKGLQCPLLHLSKPHTGDATNNSSDKGSNAAAELLGVKHTSDSSALWWWLSHPGTLTAGISVSATPHFFNAAGCSCEVDDQVLVPPAASLTTAATTSSTFWLCEWKDGISPAAAADAKRRSMQTMISIAAAAVLPAPWLAPMLAFIVYRRAHRAYRRLKKARKAADSSETGVAGEMTMSAKRSRFPGTPSIALTKGKGVLAVSDVMVTWVVTDVEGSTQLWEWDAEVTGAAVELHNNVLRGLLEQYGGHEVRTDGDSFTLAFHDAADAVAYCIKAQEQLLDVPWPAKLLQHPYCAPVYLGATCTAKNRALPEPVASDASTSKNLKDQGMLLMAGLRVRMGINTGVPDDIFVHDLTAHVEYRGEEYALTDDIAGIASGGQILMGPKTFQRWNRVFSQAPVEMEGLQVHQSDCSGQEIADHSEAAAAGQGDLLNHQGSTCSASQEQVQFQQQRPALRQHSSFVKHGIDLVAAAFTGQLWDQEDGDATQPVSRVGSLPRMFDMRDYHIFPERSTNSAAMTTGGDTLLLLNSVGGCNAVEIEHVPVDAAVEVAPTYGASDTRCASLQQHDSNMSAALLQLSNEAAVLAAAPALAFPGGLPDRLLHTEASLAQPAASRVTLDRDCMPAEQISSVAEVASLGAPMIPAGIVQVQVHAHAEAAAARVSLADAAFAHLAASRALAKWKSSALKPTAAKASCLQQPAAVGAFNSKRSSIGGINFSISTASVNASSGTEAACVHIPSARVTRDWESKASQPASSAANVTPSAAILPVQGAATGAHAPGYKAADTGKVSLADAAFAQVAASRAFTKWKTSALPTGSANTAGVSAQLSFGAFKRPSVGGINFSISTGNASTSSGESGGISAVFHQEQLVNASKPIFKRLPSRRGSLTKVADPAAGSAAAAAAAAITNAVSRRHSTSGDVPIQTPAQQLRQAESGQQKIQPAAGGTAGPVGEAKECNNMQTSENPQHQQQSPAAQERKGFSIPSIGSTRLAAGRDADGPCGGGFTVAEKHEGTDDVHTSGKSIWSFLNRVTGSVTESMMSSLLPGKSGIKLPSWSGSQAGTADNCRQPSMLRVWSNIKRHISAPSLTSKMTSTSGCAQNQAVLLDLGVYQWRPYRAAEPDVTDMDPETAATEIAAAQQEAAEAAEGGLLHLVQVQSQRLAPRMLLFDWPLKACEGNDALLQQLLPGFLDAPGATSLMFKSQRELLTELQVPHPPKPTVAVAFVAPDGIKEVHTMLGADVSQACQALFTSIVREVLLALGGYESKEVDGQVMAAFHGPRQAVEWALALQCALLQAPWPSQLAQLSSTSTVSRSKAADYSHDATATTQDHGTFYAPANVFKGVRARIGIWSGPMDRVLPHRTSGRADYLGPPANRAARMMGAAKGGQVLVEESTMQTVLSEWQELEQRRHQHAHVRPLAISANGSQVLTPGSRSSLDTGPSTPSKQQRRSQQVNLGHWLAANSRSPTVSFEAGPSLSCRASDDADNSALHAGLKSTPGPALQSSVPQSTWLSGKQKPLSSSYEYNVRKTSTESASVGITQPPWDSESVHAVKCADKLRAASHVFFDLSADGGKSSTGAEVYVKVGGGGQTGQMLTITPAPYTPQTARRLTVDVGLARGYRSSTKSTNSSAGSEAAPPILVLPEVLRRSLTTPEVAVSKDCADASAEAQQESQGRVRSTMDNADLVGAKRRNVPNTPMRRATFEFGSGVIELEELHQAVEAGFRSQQPSVTSSRPGWSSRRQSKDRDKHHPQALQPATLHQQSQRKEQQAQGQAGKADDASALKSNSIEPPTRLSAACSSKEVGVGRTSVQPCAKSSAKKVSTLRQGNPETILASLLPPSAFAQQHNNCLQQGEERQHSTSITTCDTTLSGASATASAGILGVPTVAAPMSALQTSMPNLRQHPTLTPEIEPNDNNASCIGRHAAGSVDAIGAAALAIGDLFAAELQPQLSESPPSSCPGSPQSKRRPSLLRNVSRAGDALPHFNPGSEGTASCGMSPRSSYGRDSHTNRDLLLLPCASATALVTQRETSNSSSYNAASGDNSSNSGIGINDMAASSANNAQQHPMLQSLAKVRAHRMLRRTESQKAELAHASLNASLGWSTPRAGGAGCNPAPSRHDNLFSLLSTPRGPRPGRCVALTADATSKRTSKEHDDSAVKRIAIAGSSATTLAPAVLTEGVQICMIPSEVGAACSTALESKTTAESMTKLAANTQPPGSLRDSGSSRGNSSSGMRGSSSTISSSGGGRNPMFRLLTGPICNLARGSSGNGLKDSNSQSIKAAQKLQNTPSTTYSWFAPVSAAGTLQATVTSSSSNNTSTGCIQASITSPSSALVASGTLSQPRQTAELPHDPACMRASTPDLYEYQQRHHHGNPNAAQLMPKSVSYPDLAVQVGGNNFGSLLAPVQALPSPTRVTRRTQDIPKTYYDGKFNIRDAITADMACQPARRSNSLTGSILQAGICGREQSLGVTSGSNKSRGSKSTGHSTRDSRETTENNGVMAECFKVVPGASGGNQASESITIIKYTALKQQLASESPDNADGLSVVPRLAVAAAAAAAAASSNPSSTTGSDVGSSSSGSHNRLAYQFAHLSVHVCVHRLGGFSLKGVDKVINVVSVMPAALEERIQHLPPPATARGKSRCVAPASGLLAEGNAWMPDLNQLVEWIAVSLFEQRIMEQEQCDQDAAALQMQQMQVVQQLLQQKQQQLLLAGQQQQQPHQFNMQPLATENATMLGAQVGDDPVSLSGSGAAVSTGCGSEASAVSVGSTVPAWQHQGSKHRAVSAPDLMGFAADHIPQTGADLAVLTETLPGTGSARQPCGDFTAYVRRGSGTFSGGKASSVAKAITAPETFGIPAYHGAPMTSAFNQYTRVYTSKGSKNGSRAGAMDSRQGSFAQYRTTESLGSSSRLAAESGHGVVALSAGSTSATAQHSSTWTPAVLQQAVRHSNSAHRYQFSGSEDGLAQFNNQPLRGPAVLLQRLGPSSSSSGGVDHSSPAAAFSRLSSRGPGSSTCTSGSGVMSEFVYTDGDSPNAFSMYQNEVFSSASGAGARSNTACRDEDS